MIRLLSGFLIAILCFTGCHQKKEGDHLFELLDSGYTGITFNNQLTESEQLNILTYEYFYNGGGVGIGDINNDGLQDIMFGGNMVDSKLYLNQGNLQFKDITKTAGIDIPGGWVRGVAIVDINQDGFADIYLSRAGPASAPALSNLLFINNGNNTFTEQSKEYGLDFKGNTTQTAFFDYDLDGDLDAYLVTNVMDYKGPNSIRRKKTDGSGQSTDHLFRNNGDHTFTDVSKEANILMEGYGLGISIVDVNEDGWPDVYVSNDYLSNDLLYINRKDGTFENRIADYFRHQSYSAMGNDAADIDNDGLVDFITLDMLPESNERRKNMFGMMNYERYLAEQKMGYQPQYMRNTLQRNNGNRPGTKEPFFSEIGRYANVHATDWSWSALFADFDNDGYRDLMVSNGYPKDITNRDFVVYRMAEHEQSLQGRNQATKGLVDALKKVEGAHLPNYLFRNNKDLTFSNMSAPWGFDQDSFSNGAAYADLDNDGDLDLVFNNINHEAFVYRNNQSNSKTNHFLRIRLKGDAKNPNGFGTKVWVYTGKTVQYIEHSPYRGYQSTVENTLHFGLGNHTKADSVRILWNTGQFETIRPKQLNAVLEIQKHDGQMLQRQEAAAVEPLLKSVSNTKVVHFRHIDDLYIDFKIQPLLPHLLSQNGPGIAVGDMDGDGREDFFIGGAFRQFGALFFQQQDGTFKQRTLLEGQKFEEDMGSLLFDADGDGDLDLYIVSGSNEFETGSPYYQDRLYKNDGRGRFKHDPAALPPMNVSGSVVTACDFDRDGDLDLFVGGRLAPGRYPMPGTSRLLRNERGRFTDLTQTVQPALRDIGMVTSALWTDFDQDGWIDLLIAGEWMPLKFFKNVKGKLKDISSSTGIGPSTGMWNSIGAADFDKDGDIDYVLGNIGMNIEWNSRSGSSVALFAKDFDQNGTMDPVTTVTKDGKQYPVHPRDEMTSQMNFLKKRFVYYGDYAKSTIQDIFTPEETKGAKQLPLDMAESVLIRNDGKGKFSLEQLPAAAQTGPVFGILTDDFDQDGNADILLTGNSYAQESISGVLDAFNGLLLRGDGRGNFEALQPAESGVLVEGDAKGLAALTFRDQSRMILAAQNNGELKAFSLAPKKNLLTISPNANEVAVVVSYTNGTKYRKEFYHGSGYLSQSTRMTLLPKNDIISVDIFDSRGAARRVYTK